MPRFVGSIRRGKCSWSRREANWLIQAEPHVVIKLKRVFGRVRQERTGDVVISESDEVCRDLEWFMQRYPLKIEPGDLRILRKKARCHLQLAEDIEQLASHHAAPPACDLAVPLRDYQRVAVGMALRTRGMLLADELGLGKTACGIGMFTESTTLPALVVTMPHLLIQWQLEMNRFAPHLTTHIVKKGTPYDLEKYGRDGKSQPDVTLINYHKLSKWSDWLSKHVKSVVYDECQELRRTGSDKYKAASIISNGTNYHLGLSGTPIYNYGSEFWAVLDCLRPNTLGTEEEFIREWCSGRFGKSQEASIRDPKAFGTFMREEGLMLRRTRAEVGRELPSLQIIPHHIEADLAELNKIGRDVADLAKIILSQNGSGFDKMRAAEELDFRMRHATGVAKAPFVAEFVRMLVEAGESVIVYAWHREVYSILMDRLQDLSPAMYTGSESISQKEESKRRFVEGETKVILISLRAGQGLDGLQKVCRTVVHAELDWSWAVHHQNNGRAHRDGQEHPVCAYFLVCDFGSDPVVSDVLSLKSRQLEPVLNPHQELVRQLEVDPDHVKRLALNVLRMRGESPPMSAPMGLN